MRNRIFAIFLLLATPLVIILSIILAVAMSVSDLYEWLKSYDI